MKRSTQISQKTLIILGVILVTTLLYLFLVAYNRSVEDYPPLTVTGLLVLPLDAWNIGDDLAAMTTMLVLFYLFSLTAPFRNVVMGEYHEKDTLKLAAAWAVLYLCSLALFVVREDWFGASVTLMVVLSGYLGGWQVGLIVGALTTLLVGTHNMYKYGGLDAVLVTDSWRVVVAYWRENAIYEYLLSIEASISIWVGCMAGLCAQLLGKKRWSPLAGALVGAAIALAAGYLEAAFHEVPAWTTDNLGPEAIAIGAGLAIALLIVDSVRAEEARRRAAAAELARTQAELQALRAQINPHFLFNSLNTIRYCVRVDPSSARRLLVDLSDVFQHALRSGEFVPLRDEIRYVEAYLALERARLDQRLQVEWYPISDAELDIPVPTLILQPIVENAVVHGIAQKPEGGILAIKNQIMDGHLDITVADDGVGMDPGRLAALPNAPSRRGHSIGLRNINGRLEALYGQGYRLDIQSEPDQGTTVHFRIPINGEFSGSSSVIQHAAEAIQ